MFRYPGDDHDLAAQLAAHLSAGLVDWTDFDAWEGSDEVYLQRLGCTRCMTIETAGDWSLEQCIRWNLKAVRWCVEHLETGQG